MEKLCSTYWMPLYCWARRRGKLAQDAEDLVQSFFLNLVQQDCVAYADQERGRFRDFLLASFKQFIARQHRHEHAAKRSPEQSVVSLNSNQGEGLLPQLTSAELTAEEQFDRDWALTVVQHCVARLRDEYASAGKSKLFDALRGFVTENGILSARDAAMKVGISENAVRVAAFRMRQRLGAIIQAELNETLISTDELAQEVRVLVAALEK